MPRTATAPRTRTTTRKLGRRLLGSGLFDNLAGPHGVDRYLELVRPAWTLRDPRAEVVAVERQTDDSVTLALRPNAAFKGFEAGQFIQLAVEIDGVRRTRCYSPSESVHAPGLLELTVKRHPDGLVSEYINKHAKPGLVMGLTQADGDFKLPERRPDHTLLISGGSGITPVLSMLRTLCDEGHTGRVSFVHFAPDPESMLYADTLDEIVRTNPKVTLLRAYTRVAGGELQGHLEHKQLSEAIPDFATAEAFVCGPPGLIETARSIWATEDAETRLHVESFLPPALAIRSDSAEGVLRFASAGTELANDGRSILEQAEGAGLAPMFGCRMGICHSCTCRKTAGAVRNLRSGEVSSGEDEDIQICVSTPVGDVEIEL